jgi:hypothetical protein
MKEMMLTQNITAVDEANGDMFVALYTCTTKTSK